MRKESMRFMTFIVTLMLVMAVAGNPCQAEKTLPNGSVCASRIVVDSRQDRKTFQTAELMQGFITAITGKVLPIAIDPNQPGTRGSIIIGPAAAAKCGVKLQSTYPGNEEYTILSNGDTLILAGNDAGAYQGTKMACLHYLETLGARYYRYDDPNYLMMPHKPLIRFDQLHIQSAPKYASRSIWAAFDEAKRAERQLWWDWNRLGGIYIEHAHNEFLSIEEYEKHPEYFALINGQRTHAGEWQYCTTSPGVIEMAADAAAKAFESNGNLYGYSLSARDCGGFCQCPKCLEIDAEHGIVTARWSIFCNDVREKLDQKYPQYKDRSLLFYAYWYTQQPALKVPLVKGVVPMLVIDGCHLHDLDSGRCKPNQGFLGTVRGWQSVSAEPIAVYEWYIPAIGDKRWDQFPWYAVRKPFNDQKWFTEQSVNYLYYEMEHEMRYWPYRWITYYIAARQMWDSQASAEVLLKDICDHCYGPAAGIMYEYYMLHDQQLTDSRVHGRTWHLPDPGRIYSNTVRNTMTQMLQEAMDQAQNDPAALYRVQDAARVWETGWKQLGQIGPESERKGYNLELESTR